jgi:hypothetical protein
VAIQAYAFAVAVIVRLTFAEIYYFAEAALGGGRLHCFFIFFEAGLTVWIIGA